MNTIRRIVFTILLFFWFMLITALLTEYWDPSEIMIYSGLLFWLSIGVRYVLDSMENRGDDDEEEF